MLSRRAVTTTAAAVRRPSVARIVTPSSSQHARLLSAKEDPNMNGGYPAPPPIKRQFRDPYGQWFDKQDRRNFGEVVHEDNDLIQMFSLEEYTHQKPGKAFFQLGCFVAAVFAIYGVVGLSYPDRPSYPKEYEGGLEKELGGPGAVRARQAGDSLE